MKNEFYGAVVDDENLALNLVADSFISSFRSYNVTLRLEKYANGEALLNSFRSGKLNVLFLDIDMPKIDGIEVAKQIKSMDDNVAIIFVSNCEDRVFDSFQVRPFGFVRKSSFLKDIESVTKMFISTFREDKKAEKKFEVHCGHEITMVDLSQIAYIESVRDNQFFHSPKKLTEPVKSTDRMKNLEDILAKQGFIRIHQGYLVNYLYIRKITSTDIILTNGEKLPMSRRKKNDVVTAYMRLNRNDKDILGQHPGE